MNPVGIVAESGGPVAGGGMVAVPCAELLALAGEFEAGGRLEDAERLLGHVLAAQPRNPQALHLMSVVAFRHGRLQRALELMQEAILHGIDTPLFYRNIGEMYRLLGRHAEAAEAAMRAVALNPADPLAHLNCGIILADQLRTREAISCYRRALAIDATLAAAHFGLAEALLSLGDLAAGWAEYEWRFRLPDVAQVLPPTSVAQWDGRVLEAGRLLLIADQGFGDGIQFGRYIPWAASRAKEVVLACSATLKPLLEQLDSRVRLVTEWREVGDFAAWCPLTGLPRLAGTVLETVPDAVPYLRPRPERAAQWAARLDALVPSGLRRVGLVWAGRPAHKSNWKRSMSLADLAPVAALPGIALVVLQKGPEQRQAGGYYGRAPLIHLSADIADFDDTLAILPALDLVLTVDTSVAHLAGAAGLPVWILLPWCAEWRWLQDRSDSPWYPTARLFRQPAPNDWAAAVAAVAASLAADAGKTTST